MDRLSPLGQQWIAIAEGLGLRISAPASVLLPSGTRLDVDVLLPNFGAQHGMLLVTDDRLVWPLRTAIVDAGYGFSVLSDPGANFVVHAVLDDAVELLRDWGWSGEPEAEPGWIRSR